MSLQDFVTKYNGQYVEVAGTPDAKNQCVDLANAYLKEVLGHSIVEWTNAADFPSKLTDFEWIQNTPDGVPQEGDIVVWQNTSVGHIAVFVEGSTGSFRSFDQNYPTGSPCHIQNHTYIDKMCWGRPKANLEAEIDQIRQERDRNWNYFTSVCDKLHTTTNIDIVLAEIEKLLTLEDAVREKDKQLSETQTHANELDQALKVKEGELGTLQEAQKELQKKIDEAITDNKILSAEVSKLKDNVQQPTFTGWKAFIYKILQLV